MSRFFIYSPAFVSLATYIIYTIIYNELKMVFEILLIILYD